jgi:hypothetical protein
VTARISLLQLLGTSGRELGQHHVEVGTAAITEESIAAV